jgi:hypothetical protein
MKCPPKVHSGLVLVYARKDKSWKGTLFCILTPESLVGKPEGKRPLGRPRRRWVDNIKMDLRKIGWDGANWMDKAQDRDQWRALVSTALNLRVP